MNKMARNRKAKNQRPNVRNENDQIRTGIPGDALVNAADKQLPEDIFVDVDLARISRRLSNGQIEVDLPTGDYTYRGLMLYGTCDPATALADVNGQGAVAAANLSAVSEDGRNYVFQRHFGRLISRLKLVADGITIFDFESFDRAAAYLRQFGWAFRSTDQAAFIGFGWPNVFAEHSAMRDLYALGTRDIQDLKLTIYTTDEWTDDMKIVVPAVFQPTTTPARHVLSREVWTEVFGSVGKHNFNEVRIDRRISRIIITTPAGQKISDYEVKIGDVPWIESNTHMGAAMARLLRHSFGQQPEMGPYRDTIGELEDDVGACIDLNFDMFREGRGLAPLTSQAQRRRDDRINIELTTLQADTEVTVEVWFADRL